MFRGLGFEPRMTYSGELLRRRQSDGDPPSDPELNLAQMFLILVCDHNSSCLILWTLPNLKGTQVFVILMCNFSSCNLAWMALMVCRVCSCWIHCSAKVVSF